MCCLVGTAHHRCDPTPYAHIAGRGGSFRIDRGYGGGGPRIGAIVLYAYQPIFPATINIATLKKSRKSAKFLDCSY
jgi:hypothetical protein